MQNDLLIAIIAGLGGMIGWGTSDFFAKVTVDKVGEYSTLFWSQLIGAVVLLIPILFVHNLPQVGTVDWGYLIGFGILDALTWFYLYRGFGKGEVSLLNPIFASYAAVAVLISAFLFGEKIPNLRWIALGVVFLGNLLTCIEINLAKKKKVTRIKGLPEILFALFQNAVWVVLWGYFINGKDWIFYLFIVRVVVSLSIFIICMLKKEPLIVKDKSIWKFIILTGLFDVAAYCLISFGFSKTTFVSVVAMLGGAGALPTVILGRVFLKERVNKLQTIGSGIIILGIIILSL